jgi:hypothetical protein
MQALQNICLDQPSSSSPNLTQVIYNLRGDSVQKKKSFKLIVEANGTKKNMKFSNA